MLRAVADWAWDDASMARRLETGEDILFCEEMIRREYPDRSAIHVRPADIVFDRILRVELGGGAACELLRAGGPHAADSVLCYVPSDRFLFLGDANGKDLYGQPWHFDIAHEEDLVPTLQPCPTTGHGWRSCSGCWTRWTLIPAWAATRPPCPGTSCTVH